MRNRRGVFRKVSTLYLFDLAICLRVESDKSIEHISEIIGEKPSNIFLKGKAFSKVFEPPKKNVWLFEKKYRECTEIGNKPKTILTKFLKFLML